MSSSGEKLRALFLASLMVLSVVAGTVAFSGAAAAAVGNASVTGAGNSATVGDDITFTATVDSGETVTVNNSVEGTVRQSIQVADGGSNDNDGTVNGAIDVTLTAGKSGTVTVYDPDGGSSSTSYTVGNYLVQTTPDNVTHGNTVTIEGDIYEYPGVLEDDTTLDYSLVYENVATGTALESSDMVLAESDTNDGEFSVRRTFDEVDDAGTAHLNDYPSDDFASSDPAYKVYVDDAGSSGDPSGPTSPYSQSTPRADNNIGEDLVEVRLDVTGEPQSTLTYNASVDVAGDVANASGGLASYAVKLNTPTGTTAKTTDTAQDGSYVFTANFNDAGQWTLGTNEGGYINYVNLDVGGQEAALDFTVNEENLAEFNHQYSIQLNDSRTDGALELSASDDPAAGIQEGYINVTGPFDDTSVSVTGSIIALGDSDGTDGIVEYIHVTTDGDGQASFTATPTSGASDVTASLENGDDGYATQDDATDSDSNPEPGVENNNDAGNTPNSPDYVGSESIAVGAADPVNVIDESVEDPQDTQIDQVTDTPAAPGYTDILTDSGPSIVEVLPLADVDGERLNNGYRLGFDGNQNLAGMTVYRVSFELRDENNVAIDPDDDGGSVSDTELTNITIEGAGIEGTITGGSGTISAPGDSDTNILDADYYDVDSDSESEYVFLIRPTTTDEENETITHTINVEGEDAVSLPLDAAGLNIAQFEVDGSTVESVSANTTLDVSAIVRAPYENNVPVNNGRVRLTQTGTSLNRGIDARTANVNDGRYSFSSVDVAPRGIDNGQGTGVANDGIADEISKLVFTAYQYSDVNPTNQALERKEVDRAAVEKLSIAPDTSLQIDYDPENTSVYSGFDGGDFTVTTGVEYDQIAFELTYSNGDPVNLTDGMGNNKVPLNTLAAQDLNGDGTEDFVRLVGATQDSTPVVHRVRFDTSASDPGEGYYVISDIETASSYVSSSNAGLSDSDSFAFHDSSARTVNTFQLHIMTPDASFQSNASTQGYVNAEEPSLDTTVVGVNNSVSSAPSHTASDSFTDVSNVEDMTIGIGRWYRVNATLEDALGTPINGSKFADARVEYVEDATPDNADVYFLNTLGNSGAYGGGGSPAGVNVNNASGSVQFDIRPTADDNNGTFTPQFSIWAHNYTGTWDGNFPRAWFLGTPTGQNPVVEVYDQSGARLPNASDTGNQILAHKVEQTIRVEAFQADADDLPLTGSRMYGFRNTDPIAQNIVGTTTSMANASELVTDDYISENYSTGQLGFLTLTPTGTGDAVLHLINDNDGTGTVVQDTDANDIEFDVNRANLQVDISVSPSSVTAGNSTTVTLRQQSTGDALSANVRVSLEAPNGTTIQQKDTDANGQVTFDISANSTGGTYTVSTRPAGYAPNTEEFVVEAVDDTTDIVVGGGDPATNTDSDPALEDVNGDGVANILDVQTLFANLDSSAVTNNPSAFDFNGDGEVNILDVQALFAQEA